MLDSGRFADLGGRVSNLDDAPIAIAWVIELRVQLIELCNGFAREDHVLLQGAASSVAIGRVAYEDRTFFCNNVLSRVQTEQIHRQRAALLAPGLP